MLTEQVMNKYQEADKEVTANIRESLNVISGMDTNSVMESIRNLVSSDNVIVYSDDHSIHVRVDRRKNIHKIKDEIKEEINNLIGEPIAELLLKIKVGNSMIIIKRRR